MVWGLAQILHTLLIYQDRIYMRMSTGYTLDFRHNMNGTNTIFPVSILSIATKVLSSAGKDEYWVFICL
jgi:hypothetical protein